MSTLKQDLEKALRKYRPRLATAEVRADFPRLRLNKSLLAYRSIATFQTIPLAQRLEVARVLVSESRTVGDERLLAQAFNSRMFHRSTAELASMALDPIPLDLDDDHFGQLEAADTFRTLMRNDEEKIGKEVIRKCFLARLRDACVTDILPSKRGGEHYESDEVVDGWTVQTRLEFGEALNQFNCAFRLRHVELDGAFSFTLGGLLGLGDLRWNDISRESLQEDAHKAVGLWVAMRAVIFEIVGETGKGRS